MIMSENPEAPGATEPLPAGTIGLLAAHRSDPGLMLGYWRRPEEESAVYRGEWFIGGDLAAIDEDGYLWFHGRSDDVIKSFGYRLSPVEIEAVIATHQTVAEAAVVAVAIDEGLVSPKHLVVDTFPSEQGSQRVTDATTLYKAKKNSLKSQNRSQTD